MGGGFSYDIELSMSKLGQAKVSWSGWSLYFGEKTNKLQFKLQIPQKNSKKIKAQVQGWREGLASKRLPWQA